MTAAPVEPTEVGASPRPWWRLETRELTLAFWGAVAVFSGAWWLTRFPPAIDYPQHVAMGALLNRLWRGSPEGALFEWVPLTYNGGFHVLVAVLSYAMRPELAGKVILTAIAPLTGAATLQVLALSDRPRWYAFFALPFCYSNVVGWGFVNYALGVPLAMLVLVLWLRWLEGERRLLPWLVLGALALGYTHVLAMLCFCISVGVAWLFWRTPAEVGVRRWLLGAVKGAAPLVPAVAFCLLVWWHHRQAPNIYWEDKDGQDWPAWNKLWYFARYAVGNLTGDRDQGIFMGMLGLLAGLLAAPYFGAAEPSRARRSWWALAIAWLALYFLTPLILMSTWYIYERLPVWWLTFTLPVLPVVRESWASVIRPTVVALGLAYAGTVALAFHRIPDEDDADRILDDIPADARVFAVMHDNAGDPGVWRKMYVHHVAYYLARRPGEVGYTFTKFASLPVRYKAEHRPPLIPGGLEWTPSAYTPRGDYAERYPTVLVRTPSDAPHADPARKTFGADAAYVKVLSHRGRWWLYDASGIWE